MKYLVVGAAGQVGRNLVSLCAAAGDPVVATFNTRQPPGDASALDRLDKTDPAACREVLQRHRPDVVIDTGALHNVDYCESHRDESFRVNAEGTGNLARAAREVGAQFVFVSTDFVFDGSLSRPYAEADAPQPQSEYARSKLLGERITMETEATNLVVRPSVIYSWLDTRQRAESSSGKGLNFGTWLVEEVARGRTVRIINDQVASPTLAGDLAGAILALVRHDQCGVFHTAGLTATNRFDFSVRLVQGLGLDSSLVTPVRTADLGQKAPRPVNSSLDSSALSAATGYRMLTLEAAIRRFREDFAADPGTGALRPA